MLKSAGGIASNSPLLAGRLVSTQILTGSGTYAPSAGVTAIQVTAIAAGGGGGAATPTAASNCAATGGGSGGWCWKRITSVAASYTYACGAGGAGGVAGAASGVTGGDTTFTDGASLTLTAKGGAGAGNATAADAATLISSAAPAGGAVATGGDINAAGRASLPTLWGLATLINIPNRVGHGANTPWGSGGRQAATQVAATGYGAGGPGGSGNSGAAAQDGLAGANGAILVEEYS